MFRMLTMVACAPQLRCCVLERSVDVFGAPAWIDRGGRTAVCLLARVLLMRHNVSRTPRCLGIVSPDCFHTRRWPGGLPLSLRWTAQVLLLGSSD